MPDYGLGLFQPHDRLIGGIVADITIEESERDEVTVTEHPVEQGAPIGDHAFKRPEEVTIRVGWNVAKTSDISADTGVYGFLLDWQASFVLFDLFTGKRRHRNMLISSIVVVTDQHSEYSLMASLTLKEVILTKTETAQASISDNSNNHSEPDSTAKEVNNGDQSTNSNIGTLTSDQIIASGGT